jgi:hypothetical protein
LSGLTDANRLDAAVLASVRTGLLLPGIGKHCPRLWRCGVGRRRDVPPSSISRTCRAAAVGLAWRHDGKLSV